MPLDRCERTGITKPECSCPSCLRWVCRCRECAVRPWERNSSYERQFLEQIAKAAGLSPTAVEDFFDGVNARLLKGATAYGEGSYLEADLFRELAQEPLDIAAWGVLTAQWLYLEEERGLSGEDAQLIRLQLIEAAANALRAYRAITAARELYREAKLALPPRQP